jgi:hypothetical protein
MAAQVWCSRFLSRCNLQATSEKLLLKRKKGGQEMGVSTCPHPFSRSGFLEADTDMNREIPPTSSEHKAEEVNQRTFLINRR